MISIKYHTISLVAVFLAIALGIFIGVAFVTPADIKRIADNLQQQFSQLREEIKKERAQSKQIQDILSNYRRFARLTLPSLLKDRLRGQTIGLITIGKVKEDTIANLKAAIEMAGGKVAFVVLLFPSPLLAREDALQEIIPTLAKSLVWGSQQTLNKFKKESLIDISSWQSNPNKILLVSGMDADKKRVEALDIPFINALQNLKVKIVGGEEFAPPFSVISSYRAQGIPTVDCLDYEVGAIAGIFLLEGREGNYGMGRKADALLPLAPSE